MYTFKRPNWRDNETEVFLKSWNKHAHMLRFFKKGYSRIPLYIAIVKDLKKEGFNRSMSEIFGKMRGMTQLFRRIERYGFSDYRWFNEMQEIRKIEKAARKERSVTTPLADQDLKQLYKSYIDENASALDEEATINVLEEDNGNDSDSDLTSNTVADFIEPKETNAYYISIPESSSSNSQNITENVLLDILKEFQQSNRELEENDATILGLLKEQNDIFKAHTALLKHFLLK